MGGPGRWAVNGLDIAAQARLSLPMRFRLGASAQRRLAVVLGDMLGEPLPIARDVAAFFNTYLARVPPISALGLWAAIGLIIWLPLLFTGRPRPADALAPELRGAYLSRWANARLYWIREAFFLVKTVALMGWGGHPAVRARLGMPPASARSGA